MHWCGSGNIHLLGQHTSSRRWSNGHDGCPTAMCRTLQNMPSKSTKHIKRYQRWQMTFQYISVSKSKALCSKDAFCSKCHQTPPHHLKWLDAKCSDQCSYKCLECNFGRIQHKWWTACQPAWMLMFIDRLLSAAVSRQFLCKIAKMETSLIINY